MLYLLCNTLCRFFCFCFCFNCYTFGAHGLISHVCLVLLASTSFELWGIAAAMAIIPYLLILKSLDIRNTILSNERSRRIVLMLMLFHLFLFLSFKFAMTMFQLLLYINFILIFLFLYI